MSAKTTGPPPIAGAVIVAPPSGAAPLTRGQNQDDHEHNRSSPIMWQTFLAFLARILGDDHDLVAALTDADAAGDDIDLGDGFTEEQTEALAALYNVDDEVIAATVAALTEAAQDDEVPIGDVREIASYVDGLRWVSDLRGEAAAAEDAERAALLEALAPTAQDEPTDPDDPEGDGDEGDGGDDEIVAEDQPADDDEVADPTDPDPELEPVTAAAPRIGAVAARRSKGGEQLRKVVAERRSQAEARWKMLDTIGELGIGAEVSDDEMYEAMFDRIREFAEEDGVQSVRHTIAKAEASIEGYNGDLRGMTPAEAGQAIEDYISLAVAGMHPGMSLAQAITASGGLCTPRMPLYDIPVIATAARPVRDFLATFRAERGGITFRRGRSINTLSGPNTDNSGVAIQTITKDAQGVDKPRYRVPCPATTNADVYGVPARLIHGNFLAQFDPEAVRTAVELQAAFWARTAETELLNTLDTNSDDVQTQTQGTNSAGFARFYLNSVDQLATGIRSRERTGRTFVLDHLAPFWLLDAIRSDLVLELPGSADERLATADSTIESFFSARNLRTGWFIDQQIIANQIDEGNVSNFPAEVVSYMFETGHHVVLDGGEIRQGVFRDSALNQENDAETFMESFEGLASRGVVSFALHSDICISGVTAAALDLPCGYTS